MEKVLKEVASRAGLEMLIEEYAVVLQQKAPRKPEIAPARKQNDPQKSAAAKPLKPAGAAWAKAERIVLPRVAFRSASLADCLAFLAMKAKQLDPDKHGVNLALQPNAHGNAAPITLALEQIPLSEVLRYLALISDLRVEADDSAITLRPVAH